MNLGLFSIAIFVIALPFLILKGGTARLVRQPSPMSGTGYKSKIELSGRISVPVASKFYSCFAMSTWIVFLPYDLDLNFCHVRVRQCCGA